MPNRGCYSLGKELVMSQAIANHEHLERFAGQLQTFQNQVDEGLGTLRAQFSTLSDTWQDQEQQKFELEFDEMARSVRRFIEASENHVPYLRSKAEWLRGYLEQR